MVAGFEKYYQIARCLRDEELRSDRQLEFTQFDLEMSFVTQDEILDVVERMFCAIVENFSQKKIFKKPFPKLTYNEVIKKYNSDKPDLRADKNDKKTLAFLWVCDFPMYEWNDIDNKIDFAHNPFSMPQGGMEALKTKDPIDILAYQYDIIANGLEISSGAVRNMDPEIMYEAFRLAGYEPSVVDKKFGHMIDAFQFGAPPHCGFAPGIERLAMLLLGEKNIRSVVPFPKNQKAEEPMMGSPSVVDEKQLKELHIKADR